MQAIITKYIPCTNTRGSRVKATADAGSVTLGWADALNTDENHNAAALALAHKFGWKGEYVPGGLPSNNGNVYVFTGHGRDRAAYVTDPYKVEEVEIKHLAYDQSLSQTLNRMAAGGIR